jgi:hypothetical protein
MGELSRVPTTTDPSGTSSGAELRTGTVCPSIPPKPRTSSLRAASSEDSTSASVAPVSIRRFVVWRWTLAWSGFSTITPVTPARYAASTSGSVTGT